MKKAIDILIGFIHDFAAGCWAATVLAVYWLDGVVENSPALLGTIEEIQKRFFYIGLTLVAVVLLSGAGRTFTYADIGSVYGDDAEPLRKKMLMIKHMVLFIIFGLGIWWQYHVVNH